MVIVSRAPAPRLRRALQGGMVNGAGTCSATESAEVSASVAVAEAGVALRRLDVEARGLRTAGVAPAETEDGLRAAEARLLPHYAPTSEAARRELLTSRLRTAPSGSAGVAATAQAHGGGRRVAVASSERVERDWRAGEAEGAQLPYVVAEQGRGPRWAGAAVVGVAEETRTQEAAPDETSAAETWTGAGASEARREGRRRGVRDAEDELRLELMR